MTCGLRPLPSSNAPCGQTPMQTCPVQGVHLERSIVIGDFCLSMANHKLNMRQQYICCEQSDAHANRLSNIQTRTC
jgi:hypothetical protein